MSGEFLLYQAPSGRSRTQVRLEDRTHWLTQQQLADLYESTPQNINQHIRASYTEGELMEAATCKSYLQARDEADSREGVTRIGGGVRARLQLPRTHAHGPVRADPSRAGNCCDAVATIELVAGARTAADQAPPRRETSTYEMCRSERWAVQSSDMN